MLSMLGFLRTTEKTKESRGPEQRIPARGKEQSGKALSGCLAKTQLTQNIFVKITTSAVKSKVTECHFRYAFVARFGVIHCFCFA